MAKIENKVNWKYEIGQTFKDDVKDIIIIDREIRYKEYCDKRCENKIRIKKEKYYKYHCNKDGYEDWMIEGSLERKSKYGCLFCAGKATIKGVNDIATTHPHLVKYFKNIEDTYKYSYASGKKVLMKCLDCGAEKLMVINDLNKNGFSCSVCSDKISYGEKFINNILRQLKVDFQTQLSKSTFKWCKNYRYDFYFEYNNETYICEVNGRQHYEENTNFEMSLDEQIKNDKLKKELALDNNIKPENYIVIDCRKSELNWIKDNENGILNSRLNELFDLSFIDWLQAEEFTTTNLIKKACKLKKENIQLSTTQIGLLMGGYTKTTIRKWLKKGNKLNWCEYSTNTESQRNKSIGGKKRSKRVKVFKNGIYIDTFNSTIELESLSEELFGIKFPFRKISSICLGKDKNLAEYTFQYEVNKLKTI
jgi:hypothetical protein